MGRKKNTEDARIQVEMAWITSKIRRSKKHIKNMPKMPKQTHRTKRKKSKMPQMQLHNRQRYNSSLKPSDAGSLDSPKSSGRGNSLNEREGVIQTPNPGLWRANTKHSAEKISD